MARIFQYYCLYGEPLNTNKLKSSKFLKLLRDSGVLIHGVLKQPGDPLRPKEAIDTINGIVRRASKGLSGGITQIEVDLIFKKLTSGS